MRPVGGSSDQSPVWQYISRANDASPSEAAHIITCATCDANLFGFGELLDHPKIASLSTSSYESSYRLLRLFAYGTISDYMKESSRYPTLNEKQMMKLRILTLMSVSQGRSSLDYEELEKMLCVKSRRDMEEIVLEGIYSGQVRMKMDQRKSRVDVMGAMGRDVKGEEIKKLSDQLRRFVNELNHVEEQVDERIGFVTELGRLKSLKNKAEKGGK